MDVLVEVGVASLKRDVDIGQLDLVVAHRGGCTHLSVRTHVSQL